MDSYRDDLVHESLQEALNSLPEVYRQVMMLHYFSGYKNMDIAQVTWNISPHSRRTIAYWQREIEGGDDHYDERNVQRTKIACRVHIQDR